MFKEILEFIGYRARKVFSSRLFPLTLVVVALFGALFIRMFALQVLGGAEAQKTVTESMTRTVEIPSTRGNIYDRNGVLLAYNRKVSNVTVMDDGSYSDGYERNLMVLRLIEILEAQGETVVQSVPLYLDDGGQLQTSFSSEAARLRFLRDIYGRKSVSELTEEEMASTPEEIYQFFRNKFGVGSYRNGETYLVTAAHALKCIYIRYAMYQNYYIRYNAVTVAEDVSEKTVAAILEHAPELLGVKIEQTYQRIYNNAVYFSHIIGYTGEISTEELTALNEAGGAYSAGDTVGKTGIEASMESLLQGTKGSQTMYVNNVGQIQKIISTTDPVAGENVYLSVDSSLQVGIYFLLERKLAAVLAEHLVNEEIDEEENEAHNISVKTAYNQLISNSILNTDLFSRASSASASMRLYRAYVAGREQVIADLEKELTSTVPTPYNRLPETMQDYLDVLYDVLLSEEILLRSNIDVTSSVYVSYRRQGTISLAEYLRYALENGWVDTSLLPLEMKYSSSEQVYHLLLDLVFRTVSESRVFAKSVYESLIMNGGIDRCDLALALYEQGVLVFDREWVDRLYEHSDEVAFEFLKEKIIRIELTPAQLALDPCTASATLVESGTGKVLAMVAYPGYDTNRITEADYYASLLADQSSPLFSSATQAQVAPGSSFKMVTAAASLELETLEPDTEIETLGLFTKVGMNLKCAVWPKNHGMETLWEALRDSCNYFFCEAAYRFSLVDEEYSDSTGLKIIREYAAKLGLGKKSGVEVAEYAPHISDTSAIASAIGQGSHLYSNVQLACYSATVATKGTVYDLTLLDHTTSPEGTLTKSFRGTLVEKTILEQATWDNIWMGMYAATHSGSTGALFSGNVEVAGKTGTAEESSRRPEHASFVCFAPYLMPEVSAAVSIYHGYTSGNAAQIGGQIMDFYFGYITLDQILASDANGIAEPAEEEPAGGET